MAGHPSLRRAFVYTALFAMCSALVTSACRGNSETANVLDGATATSSAVAATPTSAPQPHTVAISAGHGGPDNVGAVHLDAQGNVDLIEKDLNLDVARRLDALLRADGYRTVMIRDSDASLTQPGAGSIDATRRESQARADKANAAGAGIVLALHFNGHKDPSQSGTEVYYNPDRSFGDRNQALARFVHDALIEGIRSTGYNVRDRGIMNDDSIGERFDQAHTFLLGEAAGFRATQMPGIICEPLFVTNDAEAALLQRDDVRQAIAEAYKAGIDAYFAWLEAAQP